ncbi:MAG: YfjI family protein [Rhodocyclaceae bacterium]|nr:YfjI family protein [Rhodocyclaceae bacterium]
MTSRCIALLADCRSPVSATKRVSFAELAAMLANPERGGKDGLAWMPADIDAGPRTAERVRSISFLALDIEAESEPAKNDAGEPLRDGHGDLVKRVVGPEPPGIDEMLAELRLWGWRCILHSTYSHGGPILPEGVEHPRYRLIFDLSRPLAPAEVKPLGLHAAALLGLSDCFDSKALEPARLFYLPRCPDIDRQLMFRHEVVEGEPLDVDKLLADAERIEAARKSALTRRHPPASGSVIAAFNEQADIGRILEERGYVKKRNRWLCPKSTTGLPGVRLLPDCRDGVPRVFSDHGSDPLNDGHAHDAFDVWRILEHGGDMGKAVKEAARLLGLERPRIVQNGEAMGEPGRAAKNAPEGDSDGDYHRNAPVPDPAMLYGLAGDVARAAAATTEANSYAVALGFLTFLSAACGRDVYLPVGNTKHHARLFMLHVGRSSRGRKGDALSLVRRIQDAIEQRWREENPVAAALGFFCGQSHSGGLSTREGLALMIHDGFKSGKEEVPPIHDKRLWVIESEFSNVLHQSKRDGNTLSAALRDCWDGVSIRPATKSSRVWVSNPHVAMSAAITPSELRELIAARELTNGFLNRFLVFWAERDKLIPFPTPTPPAVVGELASRTMEVIRFAKGGYPDVFDTRPMELSAEARRRYDKFYRQIGRERLPERLAAILERRPPIVLRLAMLFALTDLQHVIEERHIEAAIAWARYHADSVRFIFQDAAGEEAAQETDEAAERILAFLKERGKATRTEIVTKCFGGHLSARRIDEAIDLLLSESPARIVVEEGERLANGKRTKHYSINRREVGEFGEVAHLVRDSASSHACEVGEVGEVGFSPAIQVRQVRQVRNEEKTPETRMVEPSSPNSPSSHVFNACESGDGDELVEVTI